MNRFFPLVVALMLTLVGCAKEQDSAAGSSAPVGADRDEHGCITSAGYLWCAKTGQCERPWELAQKAGFPDSEDGFKDYCGT